MISSNSSHVQKKLAEGVHALANFISCTYGPSGRNILIRTSEGILHPTKDGVTAASYFRLEDSDELCQLGVDLALQASTHTATIAGDGTTSAVILASSILRRILSCEGERLADERIGELTDLISKVPSFVSKVSRKVTSLHRLREVAMIASGGNKRIADIVSSACWDVGSLGSVATVTCGIPGLSSEVSKGVVVDRGLLNPSLANTDSQECIFNEELDVLLVGYKINSPKELLPLIQRNANLNRPLLIMAQDFDPTVVSAVSANKVQFNLKISLLKFPSFGRFQDDFIQDIAEVSGAHILKVERGENLHAGGIDLTSHLGTFHRCHIRADKTVLALSEAQLLKSKEIQSRLSDRFAKEADPEERNHLKARMARIGSGVATVYVGAPTEVELRTLMDLIDDTQRACFGALSKGTVKGGLVTALALFSGLCVKASNNVILHRVRDAIYDTQNKIRISEFSMIDNALDSALVLEQVLLCSLSIVKAILTIDAVCTQSKKDK